MSAEQIQIMSAIERHTAAVGQRFDDIETRMDDDRHWREVLERKVNELKIMPGTGRTAEGHDALEAFARAVKSAYPERAGQHIEYSEYCSAWRKYLRRGREVLTPEEVRAMTVGVDPDGGYLSPSQYSNELIRLEQLNSTIRGLARALPIGAGSLEVPVSLTLPTVGWVGETSARDSTDQGDLGKVELFAREVYCEPEVSQRLLDDSVLDLEAFLAGVIGEAFGIAEDGKFIAGDGVACPRGFTTYDTSSVSDITGTRPYGTIQHIATGQAGAWPASDDLIYDFLQSIVYALKPAYRRNASWVMPTSCVLKVSQLKDSQKRPLFQPSLQAGQPPTLLGFPLHESEQMPAVGSNSYSIAFANWSRAYWIVDRFGVRTLRDPYTNKPYVRFYSTRRVGGGVVDSTAIKLGKFAAS